MTEYPENNSKNNRRSDQPVRNAIDAIQELLFDPQAAHNILSVLLQHVVQITESDYGVVFAVNKDASVPISSAKLTEPLHVICQEGGIAFIDERLMRHWATRNMLTLRPVCYNDPIPDHYRQLLVHPDHIAALCVLPIVSHGQLNAFCLLAKSQGTYSSDVARRLMPVLGSTICALQSTQSVRGDFLGLDQKIADNRYLSSLMSSSPLGVIVVSPSKTILTCNPVAHDVFYPLSASEQDSVAHERLLGKSILSFIPDYELLFKWSHQRARYGTNRPVVLPQVWEAQTAIRGDGTKFLVNMTVFRYTHGSQRFTTLQIQDTSAMRESIEEYQQASQQLSALTQLVPVGIIRVDMHWNCVYANDKWYEFTGLISEETLGQQWINAIHESDVKSLLEELRDHLRHGSNYQKELQLVSPLGDVRWVELNTRVLFDEQGELQGFLATFADITERLLHEEKLRQLAEYDSLTGLTNRRLFQDRLQQAFYASERDGSVISIFFLDLDGFKDINDSLGHDAGDKLLEEVAQRLLDTLRRNDTVARFGGDEFVVLLGASEEKVDSMHVAQKILNVIAKPYEIFDQEVFITVSIGIAEGAHGTSSPNNLMKQADTALYLAKGEGKNNIQVFNKKLEEEAQTRVTLVNQLRQALKRNQFRLFFQPVADVKSQEVVGFEALLRFQDHNHQLVEPDVFIPILEDTGMIIDVGKWVIDRVCQQLHTWQSQSLFPEHGFLAFNVSPKQLLDDSIVDTILQACNRYHVNPHNLIMEVTETVIISQSNKVDKVLRDIKAIGLRLALDDFGTGYSSLSYLQKYPFDHIKVDKSFVDDLSPDSNDIEITRSIIALARSLKLKVTAEGVESAESLAVLSELGADFYQGYLLGKPAGVDDAVIQANTIQNNNVLEFSKKPQR